jgi:Indoleamine 2,3-dioxygenase
MVFYHQIRPLLAGSKNMAAAGLPNGVFYELGEGQGEWRQYSGGSNAQSSLVQLFDIALGIQHTASGEVESKKDDKQTAFMKVNIHPLPQQIAVKLTLSGNEKLYARPPSPIPRTYLFNCQHQALCTKSPRLIRR